MLINTLIRDDLTIEKFVKYHSINVSNNVKTIINELLEFLVLQSIFPYFRNLLVI